MSPNCSTSRQPPERLHRQLERAGRHRRRLVDRAGRDLQVGRAQRGHHVVRGQAARRDLAGVEPDPHRVVARAEHVDVADAVDPRQRVLDVERRVVGDVLLVARSVRRDHVHDHHQVGRGLAHGDAEALHVVRQSRLGDRDAVLHQHLRRIDVGARLEHHVDRQRAVADRLRGDVQHVVDAVHLLLDRCRDGLRRAPRPRRRDRWRGC